MGKSAVKSMGVSPPSTAYGDDLFTWVQEQVALLRAGRLDEIDAQNIAEELADVGKSERRALESAIAVLTQHLLNWDHQPARRSRSWQLTIVEQRAEILNILNDSPGLRVLIAIAIERGYFKGRTQALRETKLTDAAMPEVCPYGFDQMMTREIIFDAHEPADRRRAQS